jgi:hypothetical protein
MLPTRYRWSSMVQVPSHGSEGLSNLTQDHGRGLLLTIFYSSGDQQDVSRFEEKNWWTRMMQGIAKYVSECDTC